MVISTVNQVVYNGDGVTTAFPFTFRIIEATDIKLLLIDADGAETDITADYYVDTVNNTVYYPGYAPGAEPPAEDQPPKVQTGQKLVVYRELPITQEKDLGEKWPFYVIELGLDKLTMILQQIFDWWGRTLKISQGGSVEGFDTNIYPEAGKVVAVNETGNGFASVDAMLEKNNAWDGEGLQIHNIAGPSSVTDAATKDYVDQILNEMVIAGDSRTVPFDTLAQLRVADIVAGQIAFTLGYYDVNDGGAAVYNIRNATPSDVDNGGNIIILDNGNVAEMVRTVVVNPVQFGAKGNANYYSYGTNKWYEDIDLSSSTPAPYYDNVAGVWYASAVFADRGVYYKPDNDKYYYSASATEAPYYDNVTNKYYVSAVFADEGIYYDPNDELYYYSASATESPYYDNVDGGWYVSASFTDEGIYEYDGKHWYDAEHTIEAPYHDNVADKWYVSAIYTDQGLYTYNDKYWYIASPTPAPYYDNIGGKWYASATYSDEGAYAYNEKYWYIASATEAPYYDNVTDKWYVSAVYTGEANAYADGVWYAGATFSVEAEDDYNAVQNAVSYAEVVDGLGKRYKIYPTEVLRTGDSYQAICIRKNFKLCNTNIVLGEDADRGMCCIGINTNGYVEIENCEIDGNASNQTTVTGDGANHCIVSVRRGGEGYIHINHCTIKGGRTDGISHRSGYMLLENSMIYDDGRNGITCDKSARIFNCTFDNKNAFRLPQYSIYYEPNEGYRFVTDLDIDSCHFVYANKCIDLYPADSTSTLRNVKIQNCDCKESTRWTCVVSNTDGRVENLLIKDNYNVGIGVNSGDGSRVYFGKVILDNNTGSKITIGSSGSYSGSIEEITIKNTNFEYNQIYCRSIPNMLILENCTFDKHNSGDATSDKYQIYFPSSYYAVKNVRVKNCIFKNSRAAIAMYQLSAAGNVAIFENCVFENMYSVTNRPFKYIFLTNCICKGITSHVLSQNNLNQVVNATGCLFNQSKTNVFYKCGTVTDVGCVYSYSGS